MSREAYVGLDFGGFTRRKTELRMRQVKFQNLNRNSNMKTNIIEWSGVFLMHVFLNKTDLQKFRVQDLVLADLFLFFIFNPFDLVAPSVWTLSWHHRFDLVAPSVIHPNHWESADNWTTQPNLFRFETSVLWCHPNRLSLKARKSRPERKVVGRMLCELLRVIITPNVRSPEGKRSSSAKWEVNIGYKQNIIFTISFWITRSVRSPKWTESSPFLLDAGIRWYHPCYRFRSRGWILTSKRCV